MSEEIVSEYAVMFCPTDGISLAASFNRENTDRVLAVGELAAAAKYLNREVRSDHIERYAWVAVARSDVLSSPESEDRFANVWGVGSEELKNHYGRGVIARIPIVVD